MQWMVQAIVKAAKCSHPMSDDMRRMLMMLQMESGWKDAFNVCSPTAKTDIAQVILVLQQKGKKGFGLVMIDRPFLGEARQTECVDDIFERVTEVGFPGIYKRLRRVGIDMDCQSMFEVLLTLADSQTILNMDQQDLSEMTTDNDYVDYGNHIPRQPWRQKYVTKRHMTPDSLTQQRILFTEEDRTTAEKEATIDEIEKAIGGKPYGVET